MTELLHGTFTIRRRWAVPLERVFAAWADPQIKVQWFKGPPEGFELYRQQIDCRPGGREVLEGSWSSGMVSTFEARYHDVQAPEWLVYAYDLHHSGVHTSVTLASLGLAADGDGTAVRYTEQIVFLDGKDGTEGREHGTGLQFDGIERVLGVR